MPGDTTRLPQLRVNAATHPLIRLVANASRLLLTKWCASVQVRGLDKFLTLLRDEDRIKSGRGILTYANHISV
jgi:monolysocardiolipin acyltransferase